MRAEASKVKDFLSKDKVQFIIPIYQRNYDWGQIQCKQLLENIKSISSNNDFHFIGSIVYLHEGQYTTVEINQLIIIDGQQRITTLSLLLLAIYKIAKYTKDESLAEEIFKRYVINEFVDERVKIKLQSSESNDEIYRSIINNNLDSTPSKEETSKIIENYKYFECCISKENYKTYWEGFKKLLFVEISLELGKDNAQKIFESLNSTGLKLSQSDLIRNYILMDLDAKTQKEYFERYWEVIEKNAKVQNGSKISEFIRDYLTLKFNEISNKDNVYFEFKKRYNFKESEREALLKDLTELSKYYNKLLNPENEENQKIKAQLHELNRIEVTVSYPFLLKVYDDYQKKIITPETFIEILELIKSFTWRRFIAGLPTNALNKIFQSLYSKVDTNNYLYSIQRHLISKNIFPNDSQITEILKNKDVYNIKSKRTYLFEKLENYNNSEKVNFLENENISIEHVFPQNPNPLWRKNLDENEYKTIKESYLHVIGNLTFSGNNGKLGNKYFTDKRDSKEVGYKDSRLALNKYLSKLDVWNLVAIQKRTKLLTEIFLKIWKYPKIEIEETNELLTNIFDLSGVTNEKIEYAVFGEEKLDITAFNGLYVYIVKYFYNIDSENFLNEASKFIKLSTNKEILGNAKEIDAGLFLEAKLNSKTIVKNIISLLENFDYEDALYLKLK